MSFGSVNLYAKKISPKVFLLPAYDEFLIGYKDREALINPDYDTRRIFSSGVFKPLVLLNGRVEGIWTRKTFKNAVEITIKLFREFNQEEQEEVLSAAHIYGNFLGKELTINWK